MPARTNPSSSAVPDRAWSPTGLVALVLALVGFVFFAGRVGRVGGDAALTFARPWVTSLDLHLAFRLDGLSLLFALAVTGAGFFVALYAMAYFRGHRDRERFFVLFIFFMVAMVGLVLADDLILLFVFWELTTAASFLLIGFDHEKEAARESARQALLVTGAGGLALLAGLLLMGSAAGTWSLSGLVASGEVLRDHPHYPAILVLVLIGAFTKSAQFPFHFWLPAAMAAPTPVSAYLHSATMVKAGIYLLARLHPVLSGTPAWWWTLTVAGAVTAVWGAVLSVRATDLKVALAWTTVMALGTLTLYVGSDEPVGLAAAMTFLLVHALYKCTLFLVVGNLDHGTGTREAGLLGGLRDAMPWTSMAAIIAGLSMAGFPPFLGFLGKELKYEGALAVASEPWLAASASVVANALMVVMTGVLVLGPFFGARRETPNAPHEAPAAMLAGPLVLAGLGLVLGTVPPLVGAALIRPAVTAIVGRPVALDLALFHGVTPALLLSVLTVVLGFVGYRFRAALRRGVDRLVRTLPATGDTIYRACVAGLAGAAETVTRRLQVGRLRVYLAVTFAAMTAAIAFALLRHGPPDLPLAVAEGSPLTWSVSVLTAAGSVAVLLSRSRMVAICALGMVGAGVALLFVLHGAPDVAITQLMVDILIVAILALVLPRLPRYKFDDRPRGWFRPLDALIAGSFGLVMAVLLLLVSASGVDRSITDFYETRSVPEAFGRNIVNVILVDFRAFDTLGEIVVLAAAGLAAGTLLANRRGAS